MTDGLSIYDELKSPRDVLLMLAEKLTQLGVERMSYHLAPPFASLCGEEATVVGQGFDPQWTALYQQKSFRATDPVPDHVLSTGKPTTWLRGLAESGHRPGADGFIQRFLEMNMGDGYALPLHASNGHDGYGSVSFGPEVRTSEGAIFTPVRDHMQFAHMQIVALLRERERARHMLTPRETEVLRLIARGHTQRAISGSMGLAPASVDTYTRRIYAKLEVADRVTATLRGLTLGLIRL